MPASTAFFGLAIRGRGSPLLFFDITRTIARRRHRSTVREAPNGDSWVCGITNGEKPQEELRPPPWRGDVN
jgi:hypothetical protein